MATTSRASAQLTSLQHSLNAAVEKYQSVNGEIQANHKTRQQLLQQKSENTMVLEELNRLPDDANVYKLIGPALIKQDPVEAKSNIKKRIDYIDAELTRSENQLKSMETKMNEHQREIVKMQKKLESFSVKKGKSG